MKKFLTVLLALGVLLSLTASAGFAEDFPPQPDPLCTWVDPVYETVQHPAVTHEECDEIYTCPTVTFVYHSRLFGDLVYHVKYEKSNDPSKCHRPSDSTLLFKYGMTHTIRHAFKAEWSEWLSAEVTYENCQTIIDQPAWDEQLLVEEGYWNCPDDVCPNLEGIQTEVPEGYVKPGRRCFPKPEVPPTPEPTPVPEEPTCGTTGKAIITFQGNYLCRWKVDVKYFSEQGYIKDLPPEVLASIDWNECDLLDRGCLPDAFWKGNGRYSMVKETTCTVEPVCIPCLSDTVPQVGQGK